MRLVGQVVRELNAYLSGHPDERARIEPLFETLLDHARRGHCRHGGGCPVISAGALVVNERGEVLKARSPHGVWQFVETHVGPTDVTPRTAALRVVRETFGPLDVWSCPTHDDAPLVVDVLPAHAAPHYGFRYVFGAFSSTLPSALQDNGVAQWMPLTSIRSDVLQERVRKVLATGV
ncbi:NUDIX domain-containing protein [Streptomyces sparsogenes]|uniref:NUDIX domain-containing protein n=1 Tax=Streptomyces sparsogenes TaxID=67365 RepID=UPI0033ED2149